MKENSSYPIKENRRHLVCRLPDVCPQVVWIDALLGIERLAEIARKVRIRAPFARRDRCNRPESWRTDDPYRSVEFQAFR